MEFEKTDFDKYLLIEEYIIWIGKPRFIAFILKPIYSIFGAILFILMGKFIIKISKDEDSFFYFFYFLPFILIGLQFIWRLIIYKNTSYALSNKRIFILSGTSYYSRDLTSFYLDKIIETNVETNYIELKLKSSTVLFFTGEMNNSDDGPPKVYRKWESISNALTVYKLILDTIRAYKLSNLS
jgi:hypothetical protein